MPTPKIDKIMSHIINKVQNSSGYASVYGSQHQGRRSTDAIRDEEKAIEEMFGNPEGCHVQKLLFEKYGSAFSYMRNILTDDPILDKIFTFVMGYDYNNCVFSKLPDIEEIGTINWEFINPNVSYTPWWILDIQVAILANDNLILMPGELVPKMKVSFKYPGTTIINGREIPTKFSLTPSQKRYQYYDYKKNMFEAIGHIFGDHDRENIENLIRIIDDASSFMPKTVTGITKNWNRLFPLLDRNENPVEWGLMCNLGHVSSKSINSIKVSKIINDILNPVQNKEQLIEALSNIYDKCDPIHSQGFEWVSKIPTFITNRKKLLKSQTDRAFSKLMQDMDFVPITKESHPLTYEAMASGSIPINILFQKSEQYFLLNDNFDLWEEMLAANKNDPEPVYEIVRSANTRTHYEKDLMSYFYFVLHELPDYLKKHTGKKWKCIPKLIDSTDIELDDKDDGTTKKRSALTPIINNSLHTVTVPYANIKMYGRQTTYCYSYEYHVVQRGLTHRGTVATSDIETKLNGRDDYGVMFYTLTGSYTTRGYPTFLIIFERLTDGSTRVHFHRTHPCRSKDGDYNSVHNWIRVCYNWMVGNVPKERIVAQQGDLVFLSTEKMQFDSSPINNYDSHVFSAMARIHIKPNEKDVYSLGHIRLDEDTTLNHPEHSMISIPAGEYEVRRCRSWEANPKGIWTINID